MTALFSKLQRRMWDSANYRSLSREARELWTYLLTGKQQNAFPSLYVMILPTAAHAVQLTVDETKACLQEILDREMAIYDVATSLLWIPKAILHRVEELRGNEKNARGWRHGWDEAPWCEVKRRAYWAAVFAMEDAYGATHKVLRGFTQPASEHRVNPRPTERHWKPQVGPLGTLNPRQLDISQATRSQDGSRDRGADPRMDPGIDPEEKRRGYRRERAGAQSPLSESSKIEIRSIPADRDDQGISSDGAGASSRMRLAATTGEGWEPPRVRERSA